MVNLAIIGLELFRYSNTWSASANCVAGVVILYKEENDRWMNRSYLYSNLQYVMNTNYFL